MKSIETAGYKPGKDVFLALDCAATEYFRTASTTSHGEGEKLSPEENAAYLAGLVDSYPIISIEDGMSEDDWDGWKLLTDKIGDQVPARRRRPLRHQHRPPRARASARASPTRSSSRSTRSAR